MGKRILIVEDNSEIAIGIEFLLRREGHDVEVVGTAADAIECVEEFWPELAFIEANLPDRDGFTLCQQLRAIPTEEPPHIVLLASDTADDLADRAKLAGADDFVGIPFVTLELLARVKSVLSE